MTRPLRISSLVLVPLAILLLTGPYSYADIINLGPGSFTPLAPVIEFDEVLLGTENPVFNFTGLSGLGDVTVSFGGNFVGQVAGGGFPVTLTDHTPTGPLALDSNAPKTRTVNDGAPGATSPVLSGTPTFNGPISVLFSVPVAGVGLKGGFFDAAHSTNIEAYLSDGSILGTITNSVTGFEFYGLADATGTNSIKGISFFITGTENQGFAIDNLTFGGAGDIVPFPPPVPEPSTLTLLGAGMIGLASVRRRQRA